MTNRSTNHKHLAKFIAIMLCAVCAVFLSSCRAVSGIPNGTAYEGSEEQSTIDENIPEQSNTEQAAAGQEPEKTAPQSNANKASDAMKQTLSDNRIEDKDEAKVDKDKEYIGDMAEFILPDGLTINENNSTSSNGAEFIYMNTPYDGSFLTLTVSTLPNPNLTWEDCEDMYMRYLDSMGAYIVSEEEIENSAYPNVLINAEQTVASVDGTDTLEINTLHILFLADDKMCAVVGAYADEENADDIYEMCMQIFDTFELAN